MDPADPIYRPVFPHHFCTSQFRSLAVMVQTLFRPREIQDMLTRLLVTASLLLMVQDCLAVTPAFTRFSTFFGGDSQDSASRIARLPDGRLIVVGYSFSDDLAATRHSGPGGEVDIIVSAFSNDARQRLFSHRIGGSRRDIPRDLAVDRSGDIWITGEPDSFDFPVLNPLQAQNRGNPDTIDAADSEAFVIRLSGDDGGLLWSSYFGGSDYDAGHGIAVDDSGRVFVAGETLSADLPATYSAFDRSCGSDGRCDGKGFDAFVAVLHPGIPAPLLYASYIGGSDSDKAHALVTDSRGQRLYVAGETLSADFPVRRGPFALYADDSDGFVLVLDWQRQGHDALALASYLGGSGEDVAAAVRVTADGSIVVGGETRSDNFPVLGAWQNSPRGGSDLFISLIDSISGRLLASTRLGGNRDDSLADLHLDAGNSIWFVGNTRSGNFPLLAATQLQHRGQTDGIVGRLVAGAGGLLFSTYFGGAGEDRIAAMSAVQNGAFAITGDTESLQLPQTAGTWQVAHKGQVDMFFAGLYSPDSGVAEPRETDETGTGLIGPMLIIKLLILYTAVLVHRRRCQPAWAVLNDSASHT